MKEETGHTNITLKSCWTGKRTLIFEPIKPIEPIKKKKTGRTVSLKILYERETEAALWGNTFNKGDLQRGEMHCSLASSLITPRSILPQHTSSRTRDYTRTGRGMPAQEASCVSTVMFLGTLKNTSGTHCWGPATAIVLRVSGIWVIKMWLHTSELVWSLRKLDTHTHKC